MLPSVLRELLSGERRDDASGCFCVDCGRTYEEDHGECPGCDGHTVDRVQR